MAQSGSCAVTGSQGALREPACNTQDTTEQLMCWITNILFLLISGLLGGCRCKEFRLHCLIKTFSAGHVWIWVLTMQVEFITHSQTGLLGFTSRGLPTVPFQKKRERWSDLLYPNCTSVGLWHTPRVTSACIFQVWLALKAASLTCAWKRIYLQTRDLFKWVAGGL